jgi:carboxyl-terminal processing protease
VRCDGLDTCKPPVLHIAGALKDNCRGLLVGSRTYGKGLIQSIYELHDASGLALTV